MNDRRKRIAIDLLRIVLGLVVLIQTAPLLFGAGAIAAFARTGLPDAVRLFLGWSEIVAAILFIAPRTLIAGAWLLLAVFCLAVTLHIAHGDFNVSSLVVYVIAVIVILVHREERSKAVYE